ncbi:glycerol kinase-like [Topomyia yanbarensis]|uniref:glycerol kinase-like n=1 Tax=Topomyia yanbarensis TaxID=2498891 RepID=UPI00273BAC68|nr:glycerol kinase-like [Topomyia yanbarensis]
MNGSTRSKFGPLIGVLHVGQSSSKFLVYAAKNAEVLTCHEEQLETHSPRSGWVELDPLQIWQSASDCVERAVQNLLLLDIDPRDIVAVGICNQRETSVLWGRGDGQPLCNAIGWCDTRTSDVIGALLTRVKGKINFLKTVCGLPFANCFSAVKIRWMLDNVDGAHGKDLIFGTLDSWIIWNLTGGMNGGVHVTDVTNASRTMLMSLEKLEWDTRLCHFFKIPRNILPKIRSCSEIYGYISEGSLSGVPITSCIGDQQAALLGQLCLSAGQVTCNLDDGSFLLFNTGQEIIDSDHGLLSTVAFKLGPEADTFYALEGAIPHAGNSLNWLRENLQLPSQNGSLSQSFVGDPGHSALLSSICSKKSLTPYSEPGGFKNPNYEVILVPAFSGYYTPYWRYKARGMLFGLTLQTTAAQIMFSAYEAVCFQVREILESLAKDCRTWPTLTKLVAGGELSEKSFLMQMLADLSGISIERPQTSTPVCLGTMLAAGLAVEVLTLDDFRTSCIPPIDYYTPVLSSSQRDMKFRKWKVAVDRCLNFDSVSETDLSKFLQEEDDPDRSVRCSIPGGVYIVSSFALIVLAQILQQNRSS